MTRYFSDIHHFLSDGDAVRRRIARRGRQMMKQRIRTAMNGRFRLIQNRLPIHIEITRRRRQRRKRRWRWWTIETLTNRIFEKKKKKIQERNRRIRKLSVNFKCTCHHCSASPLLDVRVRIDWLWYLCRRPTTLSFIRISPATAQHFVSLRHWLNRNIPVDYSQCSLGKHQLEQKNKRSPRGSPVRNLVGGRIRLCSRSNLKT